MFEMEWLIILMVEKVVQCMHRLYEKPFFTPDVIFLSLLIRVSVNILQYGKTKAALPNVMI